MNASTQYAIYCKRDNTYLEDSDEEWEYEFSPYDIFKTRQDTCKEDMEYIFEVCKQELVDTLGFEEVVFMDLHIIKLCLAVKIEETPKWGGNVVHVDITALVPLSIDKVEVKLMATEPVDNFWELK